MPGGYLQCSLNNRGKEGKKEEEGERERVSSILLSSRIWFSTIKKGDIEECFSFHHFAVGNCFPHGALGFDVSPAAVTQVTARAVPVQMCYLSVSLLTLWLNRSSCGQRAISALYHTIWHLMESFRVLSWKNFLPSIAGSFEEINILCDAKECPEKQLSFPTQIQAWHHLCLQYDFHILWTSACPGATNVCQPGKPLVYFWRPSVSRKWCKSGVRTIWKNKTMLISQARRCHQSAAL